MKSHLLLLVIFAFFVSIVFAVLSKDDPRLLELTAEAELLGRRLGPKTAAERALVAETQR